MATTNCNGEHPDFSTALVFCDNWLAKLILPKDYSTIMLFMCILSKHSVLTAEELRHENIHRCQYIEMFLAGLVASLLFASFGASTQFCLTFPLFLYYIWYGVEYAIAHLYHKRQEVIHENEQSCEYHSIAFEEEAHQHDKDSEYLTYRPIFAWVDYLGSICKKKQ